MFQKLSLPKTTYFLLLGVAALSLIAGLFDYQDNRSLYQVKIDTKVLTKS